MKYKTKRDSNTLTKNNALKKSMLEFKEVTNAHAKKVHGMRL